MRAVLALLLLAIFAAPAQAAPPDIRHVWIITLENKDYEESFGPDTAAPFLARELTKSGQLLTNYFGTSHLSLGNYITMVSGQAANPETQGDCFIFRDVFPGIVDAEGQAIGQGCVYPPAVKTIANQLEDKGLRWRGYMEDMGNTEGEPQTCRHPAANEQDPTQSARANDQYAARHNPFVYFHAILDSPTCDRNDVPLTQLLEDVKSEATTPNYGFITPDLCNDGHDTPCVDGGPGGLAAADTFLREWVPRILASPGFAEHGLLVVTWDEANVDPDSSTACCDQPTGPNTPSPGIVGPGGGRTGTVLISPFVKPGTVNETPYNHYGLLRSVEEIFGLPYLGYAGRPGLKSFGDDVYSGAPAPAAPPRPKAACRPERTGKAIQALRLRDRLVTFRARRSVRIKVTPKTRKAPKRIVGCRSYTFAVRKGPWGGRSRAAGLTFRARRGPRAPHDSES